MFPVHLTWRQHKMSKFQKIKKVTTAFILKVYRNLYEAGFVGMKDIFLNCTQNFYWNKEITDVNVLQIIGLDLSKKKKNPKR